MTEHICRTAGCFAGWRAFRDGYTFQGWDRWGGSLTNASGHMLGNIGQYASDELELTRAEANRLFNYENSLSDLKFIVDDLCAQPERSEESQRKLRETMDDVLAANAEGLWDQENWFTVLDGDYQ